MSRLFSLALRLVLMIPIFRLITSAWTSPTTWTATLVTVAQFNQQIRDNLLALKSPPVAIAMPNDIYTTSSTSFVDIDTDDFSCSVTFAGSVALIWFVCTLQHSDTGGIINFNISVDDVNQYGDDGIACIRPMDFTTSHRMPVTIIHRLSGITPGTRNIRMKWKTSGATATLHAHGGGGNGANIYSQFGVVELT